MEFVLIATGLLYFVPIGVYFYIIHKHPEDADKLNAGMNKWANSLEKPKQSYSYQYTWTQKPITVYHAGPRGVMLPSTEYQIRQEQVYKKTE